MIERVIENWLTSVNERQYQLPFCQVLAAEGETVVYISTHGPLELGKDIVTVAKDGVPNAYQLKAGDVAMRDWRSFKGEIEQLVEYPLHLPSIRTQRAHRSFFVTNGQINAVVVNAIQHMNFGLKKRNFNQLNTIGAGELLARFKAAHGNYLPRQPIDLEMFLRLYVRDGREPFAKADMSKFLEHVLLLTDTKRSQLEVRRAAASIVLLTSYVIHDCEVKANHWAIFEAWVVTASYILAMATKFATPKIWWENSFNLCLEASARALKGLTDECEVNTTKFLNLDLVDGFFYGSRITILAGMLGAYDLLRQKINGDKPIEFVGKFLDENLMSAKFWGESAAPFLLVAALALESHGHQKNAELLVFQLVSVMAEGERFSERGVPNPYYGPEASIRLVGGLDELNTEDFRGTSYALEPAIQFLARRWLRQNLARMWDKITKTYYAAFIPLHGWQWFLWKSTEGSLVWKHPGKPQSWTLLLQESERPDPHGAPTALSSYVTFTLFFILVFPHRCQPYMLALIENWLTDDSPQG